VLFLSILAAFAHVSLLLLAEHEYNWLEELLQVVHIDRDHLRDTVTMIAVTLPTVALAMQGLKALYEWRRLRLAYHDQAQAIDRVKVRLQDIIDGRLKDGVPRELAFQRLVLRAEELFAAELHQWYVLVRAESMSA